MTALPQWVRPQLTQLVDTAPEGDQWLHEIKYDGYRMHARLDRGRVKLLTRTGLDWMLRGKQDEKRASIGMRKCRRMRDGGRA
jgi:ATP-dependent DNA ligase